MPVNIPPGAAYVFERVGSAWLEVAKLSASSTGPGEAFGDGGAPDADTAVVLNPLYVDEVRRQLTELGLSTDVVTLPAA